MTDPVQDWVARSGDQHKPSQGWQDGVFRRLDAPSLDLPLELSTKQRRRSSLVWQVALAAIFFAVPTFAYFQNRATETQREQNAQAQLLEQQEDFEAEYVRLQLEIELALAAMEDAVRQLAADHSEESRDQAMAASKAAKANLEAKRAKMKRLRQAASKKKAKTQAKKKEKAVINKCSLSDDPLCGM